MALFAGGVSIRGIHPENQDSLLFHRLEDGWFLAVSDGVGSRKDSRRGSRAVCYAAWKRACLLSGAEIAENPAEFACGVHTEWLRKLRRQGVTDVNSCCATFLFLLVLPNQAVAIQLGDGFIGVYADEKIHILFDDKLERYENDTSAFCDTFDASQLRWKVIPFQQIQGAVLCSDGVGIGENEEADFQNFTRDFVENYSQMSWNVVRGNVESWLSDWVGGDDKTIAYLLCEGGKQ